ncbi:MAG: S41 family peptidase, partial [Anaerolineales bacterium]
MKADRLSILILLPLVLSGIACQAVEGVITLTPSPELQRLAHQPLRASPTMLPTITPPATATPTSTAIPSAAPTPTPTPSPFQHSVFQELWQVVSEDYLYPDFNGLDWGAVYDLYDGQIESGMSDSDFYLAMSEMVASLGDDHSVFLDPGQVKTEEAEFSGENNFVGVGILTTTVPERDRIVIILTFPGSPAERAGLQPHDSILAADGIPVMDERGFRRELLLGEAGTQVTLIVQSPGGEPREVH